MNSTAYYQKTFLRSVIITVIRIITIYKIIKNRKRLNKY